MINFGNLHKKVALYLMLVMEIYLAGYGEPVSSIKSGQSDSAAVRMQNPKALAIGRFGDKIKFDDDGIPIEIEGNLSKGITVKGAANKTYLFFEVNKDILGITNPREVLVIDDVHFEDAIVVKLHMVVNRINIPSSYVLTFTPDEILYRYSGGVDPRVRGINLHPAISEEQAFEICLIDSKTYNTAMENVRSLGLVIGRAEGLFKLMWVINVRKTDTIVFDYDYYIDAQTGKKLGMHTNVFD
jgi:hypothetical protein